METSTNEQPRNEKLTIKIYEGYRYWAKKRALKTGQYSYVYKYKVN